MATTMAANTTSTNNSSMHYTTESSMELTKRFAQMQLKTANCIPKRQPTIVCEDIADDDLIDDSEGEEKEENSKCESLSGHQMSRSASSASLTVPVHCEDEITEKRRPPLPEN